MDSNIINNDTLLHSYSSGVKFNFILKHSYGIKALGESEREFLKSKISFSRLQQTHILILQLRMLQILFLYASIKNNYLLWRTQELALIEIQDMIGFLNGEY